MSGAEEIKRLAELRDQGLISPADFYKKKTQILKGKRPWWLTAIIWIIGVLCLVALVSILVAIFMPAIRNAMARGELTCDTPEVKEKVVSLLNEQIANARRQLGVFGDLIPAGTLIHSLADADQLYRDSDSGFVACIAKTKNDKGEGNVGYTVSWRDRNSGEFWVQIEDAKELRARYATPSTDAASQELPRDEDGSPVAQTVEPEPEPVELTISPEERQAEDDAATLARHQSQGTPDIHGQIVATVEVPRHGTITLTDTNDSFINKRCGQSQRDGIKSAGIESAPDRVCWSSKGEGDIVVKTNSSGYRFRIPASDFQPNADYVARVQSEDGRRWYERLPAPPVQGNVVATYDHEVLGKLLLTDTSCQMAGKQFVVQSMGSPHQIPSSGCWTENRDTVYGFIRLPGGSATRFSFASQEAVMKH